MNTHTQNWNFGKALIVVHYNMISDIKVDPKNIVSKQKCIDYIEKWPYMVKQN